jgi:hypothetical protein
MESNRSDNRRRRVLYDEAVQQTAIAANSTTVPAPKRRRANTYNPRGIHQLKTSDLIPTRFVSLGLVIVASALAIVAVNLLDAFASSESVVLNDAARRAFDILSPSGLRNWMLSVVFTIAALFCLQVYVMRRHRRDDYRGTYRVWILFSMVCLFAGLQSIVPLAQVGAMWLAQSIHSPALQPGTVAHASILVSLIAAVSLRATIDMSASRLALLFAAVSFLGYL